RLHLSRRRVVAGAPRSDADAPCPAQSPDGPGPLTDRPRRRAPADLGPCRPGHLSDRQRGGESRAAPEESPLVGPPRLVLLLRRRHCARGDGGGEAGHRGNRVHVAWVGYGLRRGPDPITKEDRMEQEQTANPAADALRIEME